MAAIGYLKLRGEGLTLRCNDLNWRLEVRIGHDSGTLCTRALRNDETATNRERTSASLR